MNDEISAITFGFYAAEDITAVDGSVIPADGLIEIMSLDENGKSVLNTDLPFGSYYVQEISTDCHYILSDEKYPVVFGYLGQDISAVSLQVNGGSITNDLIYGEINGLKKDENGTGLGGAMIGLFTTTGEEPILTTISADDGSFTFKDVPYGEYVVREIMAPEGYVLDETPYTVKIDVDGAVIEVEITDTLIRGNVQLTKVDKDYPDHHLTGAVFEVYSGDTLIGVMEVPQSRLLLPPTRQLSRSARPSLRRSKQLLPQSKSLPFAERLTVRIFTSASFLRMQSPEKNQFRKGGNTMGQYKYMTKSHGVKWSAKFRYLNPETGEMDIEYRRGFDTKREAKQYEDDFLEELKGLEKASPSPAKDSPPRRTFYQVYQEYLASHKHEDLKLSTLETKKNIFTKHIFPTFRNVGIDEITSDDIYHWQLAIKEAKSPQGKPFVRPLV